MRIRNISLQSNLIIDDIRQNENHEQVLHFINMNYPGKKYILFDDERINSLLPNGGIEIIDDSLIIGPPFTCIPGDIKAQIVGIIEGTVGIEAQPVSPVFTLRIQGKTETDSITRMALKQYTNHTDRDFNNRTSKENVYYSVMEMVEDRELQDGMFVRTLGFYSSNGRGCIFGEVTNSYSETETDYYIPLKNGRFVHVYSDLKDPECYGADYTGQKVIETTKAINQCALVNQGGTVYIKSGKYRINAPIKTYVTSAKRCSFILDPNTWIEDDGTIMDALFYIGGLEPNAKDEYGGSRMQTFRGGKLIAKGAKCAILKQTCVKLLMIRDTYIYTYGNGIVFDGGKFGWSSDCYIESCIIRSAISHEQFNSSSDYDQNSGIVIYTHDNNISNCRINCFPRAVTVHGNGNMFENIHDLVNQRIDDKAYQKTCFAYLGKSAGLTIFTNCYADGDHTFIKSVQERTGGFRLIAPFYYSPLTKPICLFDLTEAVKGVNVSITNGDFNIPDNNSVWMTGKPNLIEDNNRIVNKERLTKKLW